MKNIFKLMGVALIAGSMLFVACGKDDNTDDNNNNNNNNNEPVEKCTVTFGTNTWEAGSTQLVDQYVATYGLLYERIFKVENQLPYVDIFHTTTAGNYTSSAVMKTVNEGTDSAYTQVDSYTDEDHIYLIEYGEQTQIQTGAQSYSGDWGLLEAQMTVGNCDLNTLTLNYSVNATMYDFYSWIYGIANDVEDADTKTLTIAVENFKFTLAQ